MSTLSLHRLWKKYIEIPLVGTLEPDTRRNMYVDLTAACIRSIMTAIVAFIPVILWRSGASPGQMAYYFAVTVLGLITMGEELRPKTPPVRQAPPVFQRRDGRLRGS